MWAGTKLLPLTLISLARLPSPPADIDLFVKGISDELR